MDDPARAPAADEPDWFQRWGRRAATGTAALLATLAVAGVGLWVYNENKVDKSLSVLAKAPIPARPALPAPGVRTLPAPAIAPPTAAAAAAGPQAAANPQAAAQAATQAAAPPPLAASTGPPAVNEPPGRTERTGRPRTRSLASRTKTPPAAAVQAKYASQKPERAGALTETLRQCRAAGYHAAQCVQLGCTATQYGLACKGGGARP
jgi:hypothetical protein